MSRLEIKEAEAWIALAYAKADAVEAAQAEVLAYIEWLADAAHMERVA